MAILVTPKKAIFWHYFYHTYAKEQICWLVVYDMNLQYPRYHCTTPMLLLVDNSDSPSKVEQSQQECDSSCNTLLTIIPSSVKYPILYACQLASCNVGTSCHVLLSLCVLAFPVFFSSTTYINSGSVAPFYLGCFLIEPWDSLSGYVHSGIACLASWASDWAGAFFF